MRRIKLKERCYIADQLLEAGAIVTLPDGARGPHRAVRKSQDRLDYSSGKTRRLLGELIEVPLFDVLPDVPAGHTPEQQAGADAAAAARQAAPRASDPAPIASRTPGLRVRLKARVQLLGRIHEAGETIDWPAGVALPFRTTIDASSTIGLNISAAELRAKYDTPLFELIDEAT